MERQAMKRTIKKTSQGLMCGVLLALAGCATPQKPVYDFIPPASKAGLVCLKSCQAQSSACERKVDLLTNQCRVKAGQQAKTELPGRIAAYENSLAAWKTTMRRYQRDVSMYELQMRHYRMMASLSYAGCRDKKGKKSRDCRRHGSFLRSPLWSDRPVAPQEMPERPTFKNVQSEIAGKQCAQQKTQCEVSYRQCYVKCGGTVKLR